VVNATSIAVLIIFVGAALLMYSGRLPALLALPLMAVAIAAAARISPQIILTEVVEKGLFRLHPAYVTAMLGAVLAEVMSKTGIAETMIKKAAELGGDRPLLLSLLLTAVVALLFTTLGGLGAVIMVATIVFPILLTLGIAPLPVGGMFLLGMSLGGIFNLTNWQLYKELGLETGTIMRFAIPLAVVFALVTVVFAVIETRRGANKFWAAAPLPETRRPVNFLALLTPLIPLLLVLVFALRKQITHNPGAFEFPITAAMIAGIIWGLLTTWKPGTGAKLLSRSIFEGLGNVAPAVALMFGIGMLVNAVMLPEVLKSLQPILRSVMPHSPISYVIFFTIFAPLALYRGPLNIWGLGFGIGKMMAAILPPAGVMAALLSVGQIQGICDPTNTHNVWIANHLGLDVNQILKRTLPYVWAGAAVGLVAGAILFLTK
jgi:Na+/H+ antiporter NhaD/arsenite permease-like protein